MYKVVGLQTGERNEKIIEAVTAARMVGILIFRVEKRSELRISCSLPAIIRLLKDSNRSGNRLTTKACGVSSR
ncbi:MAG: hypothetical protein ACOCQC_00720 [Halanaerobiaceae bacterium]